MNTPVNSILAKLLKEKGFDEPSIYYWFENSSVSVPTRTIDYKSEDWNNYPSGLRISSPTIAEVVMWLYEKHGIWISVFNDDVNFFWMGIVLNTKERLRDGNAREFNSPTEAYEAAIEYTLNNLI